MKVVVFAHTPPPHHGQSYMVELMLRGFANKEFGIECFHVNARFATDSLDIGRFRLGKAFQLLGYCAQAIWKRFRHGAAILYYVPSPTLRNSLFRDWVILLLCRPFFRRVIFHWHAAGLGEWVNQLPGWMRWISHLALDRPDLSISLGKFNEQDAERFHPKRSVVVPNGIPDPCPNFADSQRRWRERLRQRQSGSASTVKVLYLSLCTRQKGFLDAIHGVVQANAKESPFTFELAVAGPFFEPADEAAYRETMEKFQHPRTIQHLGFVSGEAKTRVLDEADILCFPTYYLAENLPLVLLEALAFGLPIISTRWRSVPEILPPNSPGLVDIQSPEQIAAALIELASKDVSQIQRDHFLKFYTIDSHLNALAAAFKSLD